MNLIILFTWLQLLTSDQNRDSLIYWDSQNKLKWEYFSGTIESSEFIYGEEPDALSATSIEIYLDSLNRYKVRAFFNCSKSWVKDSSDLLLSHEQVHFDISEICARRLQKQIETDTSVSQLQVKYDKVLLELDSINRKYDIQTGHGSIKVLQKRWEQKVEEELINSL